MKKYHVKDADGVEYSVEEIEEMKKDEDPEVTPEATDEGLLPEEIAALKKLAAVADKLVEMVSDDDDPMVADDDDEEKHRCEEELIDTDEEESMKKRARDSVGSIETRKKISVDDSLDDDVSLAWQKRYSK